MEIETKWGKSSTFDNGITLSKMKPLTYLADIGLRVAGAATMYGIGKIIGEGIEHLPHVNDFVYQTTQNLAGVDVRGNISNLVGLMGATYGLVSSGISLNDEMRPKRVSLKPISINFKS